MAPHHLDDDMTTRSPVQQTLLQRALRFARVDVTVLITGESGTGKERLAHYLHRSSRRAARPFVPVNTGAIPENLLESELFGYLKGAFTGAMHDAPGLFEAANGGTLFLDEVGEMPLAMQAKLLRALQEHEVRPVGARAPRPVDVRIIAATNADLGALIACGRFREDLYFRLHVVGLRVPALRERPEDILPLAATLLAHARQRQGSAPARLARAAEEALLRHRWPGNVRELENAMEHAAALTDDEVVRDDALPDTVRGLGSGVTKGKARREGGEALTLAEVERRHIETVLAMTGGNRVQAAAILGVAPSTLWRRSQSRPRRR